MIYKINNRESVRDDSLKFLRLFNSLVEIDDNLFQFLILHYLQSCQIYGDIFWDSFNGNPKLIDMVECSKKYLTIVEIIESYGLVDVDKIYKIKLREGYRRLAYLYTEIFLQTQNNNVLNQAVNYGEKALTNFRVLDRLTTDSQLTLAGIKYNYARSLYLLSRQQADKNQLRSSLKLFKESYKMSKQISNREMMRFAKDFIDIIENDMNN